MEPSPRRRHPVLRGATAALAVVLVITLLGWSVALPAAADTVEFTITDPDIIESSGLATDAEAERYWTVNDSGDAGVAYALDDQGETRGTLQFRVEPVDVEAVAFHEGRLYVADIGDNRARRDSVTVYFFDDADPATEPVVYKAYDFSYPDGPHDAETLLVDGDGRLFIVTKGVEGGIYAAPTSPSRQGVNELERVGDAPAFVTDGTVLPDGRFALRTYVSVEIVDPDSYEVVARAATPAQKQGESITTTFDGKDLLVGSEGRRSKVLRIDVPTALDAAPTPSASTADHLAQVPARTQSPGERDSGVRVALGGEDSAASEDDVPEDPGASAIQPAGDPRRPRAGRGDRHRRRLGRGADPTSVTAVARHRRARRQSRSITQSMQAHRALTSSGSTFGYMPTPELVATQLAVGLGVDDPVRPQHPGDRGRVDAVEVDGADDRRSQSGIGDERRRVRSRLRPGVEPGRRVVRSGRGEAAARPGR